jgi:hypothetical protein
MERSTFTVETPVKPVRVSLYCGKCKTDHPPDMKLLNTIETYPARYVYGCIVCKNTFKTGEVFPRIDYKS